MASEIANLFSSSQFRRAPVAKRAAAPAPAKEAEAPSSPSSTSSDVKETASGGSSGKKRRRASTAPLDGKTADERRGADLVRLGRTIFVGNVPATAIKNKSMLKNLFRECGRIESMRFRSLVIEGTPINRSRDMKLQRRACAILGKVTEASTCNAYVVFDEESAAAGAVEKAVELNGCVLGENHLRIDTVDGGQVRDYIFHARI